MDEQPQKFSVENAFYRNQILQDLPVAVLKDGRWGSYRNLESHVEKSIELNLPTTQSKDIRYDYNEQKYRREL
jgi:hypothetical protein